MKRQLLFLSLLISITAVAQPINFRTMFRDNPATSMVIGCSQELTGTGSNFTLFYSKVDHGVDTAAYRADNQPLLADKTLQFKARNHYFFRLQNLDADQAYYFVVVYEDLLGVKSISNRYWSSTIPDNPNKPLSIISGGDSRADLEHPDQTAESIIIRQQANLMVSKLRPHFVAFGGDYTFANSDSEWHDWLDDWELTHGDDGKITPIVAAIGNHEYPPFAAPNGATVVESLFDVPSADAYYALSFGGNLLRLYTLNSEMAIPGDQSNWLSDDLEATGNSVYWKMAQYHKPIRPHEAGKSDLNDGFEYWAPEFWEHQVRLVVESDAHVVKTTHPLMPSFTADGTIIANDTVDHNFVRTNNRGTVYVGEGTWAALRSGNDPKLWTRAMGGFNQIKWIWVSKDTIQVRTVITYDENDPNYVASIPAVDDNNRFQEPNNIQIWEPSSGRVVYITENGTTNRPSLGIDHMNLTETKLMIWPNHIKDGIARVMVVNPVVREATLSLYNVAGKKLHQQQLLAQGRYMETSIDLSEHPNGILFIQVDLGTESLIERIVLNK